MPEFAAKRHENLVPTRVQVVPKNRPKPGSQTQNRAKQFNKIDIQLLLRDQGREVQILSACRDVGRAEQRNSIVETTKVS